MARPPGPIRCGAPRLPGIPRMLAGCAAGPASDPPGADLPPIVVQDGRLEIDVGSRIPAGIVVSGTRPERCSQLAEIWQVSRDHRIEIALHATPLEPGCLQDEIACHSESRYRSKRRAACG